MEKIKIVLCLLTSLFLGISNVSGQSDSILTTYIRTANLGDEIVVRWIPGDYNSWRAGMDNGYTLERFTISEYGVSLTPIEIDSSRVLLSDSLIAKQDSFWLTMIDTNDFAGVAAAALYGDSLDVIPMDSLTLEKVYNINTQNENRYNMCLFAADQDFTVATHLGLAFIDTSVVEGDEYLYNIRVNSMPGFSQKFNTEVVNTLDTLRLPEIGEIQVIPGDSTVLLKWETASLESFYNSYFIEKSIDGGQTFFQLNEKPIVGTTGNSDYNIFGDTLSNNDSTFVYRLKGYSPFGLVGPTSDTVQAKGVYSAIPAYPSFRETYESSAGVITINWTFPNNYLSKLQGFNVYRSGNDVFGFEKLNTELLTIGDSSYVDSNPLSSNYYKVESIDIYGNSRESVPRLVQLIDSIPPSPPSGVICQADENGLVTISWGANAEPDLSGYKVLTSNVGTEEYSMLTNQKIKDTSFQHTIDLNILNESLYYAVYALDRRDNQSSFSQVCTLKVPDLIPPTPPTFKEAYPVSNGVYFKWNLSSSKDAETYFLERKKTTSRDWEAVVDFQHANPIYSFTDTLASHRHKYTYRLLVEDDDGNTASSKFFHIKPLDNGIRDSIENFDLTQMGDNGVLVSWDYDKSDPDLIGFEVFRAVNNEAIYSFKYLTVEAAANDWIPYGGSQNQLFGFFDDTVFRTNINPNNTTLINPPNNVNGTMVVLNPPYPGSPSVFPGSSRVVKYQVLAHFRDGATSPLTDILVLFVN